MHIKIVKYGLLPLPNCTLQQLGGWKQFTGKRKGVVVGKYQGEWWSDGGALFKGGVPNGISKLKSVHDPSKLSSHLIGDLLSSLSHDMTKITWIGVVEGESLVVGLSETSPPFAVFISEKYYKLANVLHTGLTYTARMHTSLSSYDSSAILLSSNGEQVGAIEPIIADEDLLNCIPKEKGNVFLDRCHPLCAICGNMIFDDLVIRNSAYYHIHCSREKQLTDTIRLLIAQQTGKQVEEISKEEVEERIQIDHKELT